MLKQKSENLIVLFRHRAAQCWPEALLVLCLTDCRVGLGVGFDPKPEDCCANAQCMAKQNPKLELLCGIVAPDKTQAAHWYHRAAEHGYAPAQFELAKAYGAGDGIPKNMIESVKWYRKAADQGEVRAMEPLGDAYHIGSGVRRDDVEAAKWFLKTPKGHDTAGGSTSYLKGKLGPAYWPSIREAANHGDSDAQFYLAYVYGSGVGVRADQTEHLKWLNRGAQNDMGAGITQTYLCEIYASGEGVQRNDVEAEKWCQKAADEGTAEAQNNLGAMYEKGAGVPKDLGEAAEWYSKAARQGYAVAQTNLGSMYSLGRGVQKDWREAATLFRQASEKGNTDAQTSLGFAYLLGQGVSKDVVTAYMWFNIASRTGTTAKNQRDQVEKDMTGEQIAEGQRLTSEWLAKH